MRSPGAKMDAVSITRNFAVKDAEGRSPDPTPSQREGSWASPALLL
jgi:hypothetical protein